MKRIAAFVLAFAVHTVSAEAVNNTVGNAIPTALGQVRSMTVAASDLAYWGYTLVPDRSYAGFCWLSGIENASLASGWCHVTLRDLSDNQLATESQSAEPNPRSGASITYQSTSSPTAVFARIQNVVGSPQQINFVLFDTTLASPWYFVTPGVYDSYVEVRNQSTVSTSVTLRAYTPTGTVAGTSTVSVPGNGSTLITLSSLGISSGSGSATLTHTGMPGTIVANTTTLSATTGLSFDAPFVPRMQWATFP